MKPDYLSILSYALLPFTSMIIGGLLSIWRKPGSAMRGIIMHFAAGVVFAVVAVEILPDLVKEPQPLMITIGFSLGVLLMLAIRYFSRKVEKKEKSQKNSTKKLPMGLLTGIGVDILLDGLLIGISFAAGAKEGLLLTIALTIEILSLGLAVSSELGQEKILPKKIILIVSFLASMIVIGALLGTVLLSVLSESAMKLVLSFGLAALLYLITEELLVEAHEEKDTPFITATFFLGFLVFLILGIME